MSTLNEMLDELKERIIDELKEEGILEPDEKGYRGVEIISAATIPELENTGWIPVEERLPEDDSYILLSFDNFDIPMIGRYEADSDGGGAFYLGDNNEQDTCISENLFVNAWMPLPEPYQDELGF